MKAICRYRDDISLHALISPPRANDPKPFTIDFRYVIEIIRFEIWWFIIMREKIVGGLFPNERNDGMIIGG